MTEKTPQDLEEVVRLMNQIETDGPVNDMWVEFRDMALKEAPTPVEMVSQRAFYAGVLSLYSGLMGIVNPDNPELEERETDYMSAIDSELRDYATKHVTAMASPAGSA